MSVLALGPEFETWGVGHLCGMSVLVGGLAAIGYLAGVRHSRAALVAAFTGAVVTVFVIMLAGW